MKELKFSEVILTFTIAYQNMKIIRNYIKLFEIKTIIKIWLNLHETSVKIQFFNVNLRYQLDLKSFL